MIVQEIKTMRMKLGYTQAQFADELGVCINTDNRWENGHADPSALALYRLQNYQPKKIVPVETPVDNKEK